jgi:pimeloyl-ACP methyl ester carboxylesterase
MKHTILILHGWGLSGSSYQTLQHLLEQKGYRVFSLDLPGFGSEPLKNSSMQLSDYVFFVKEFIDKKKIIKPILIGHSFGGRVAIKYAYTYPQDVDKLILTGVPIVRHLSMKKKIAFVLSQLFKIVLSPFPVSIKQFIRKGMYYLLGEWDYYKSGPLRDTFTNIINEDLTEYVSNLSIPVLLVWGADDRLTPAGDVNKILGLLPQTKFRIIAQQGHKLPYTNPAAFSKALDSFL